MSHLGPEEDQSFLVKTLVRASATVFNWYRKNLYHSSFATSAIFLSISSIIKTCKTYSLFNYDSISMLPAVTNGFEVHVNWHAWIT